MIDNLFEFLKAYLDCIRFIKRQIVWPLLTVNIVDIFCK